jgi:hypothetical protein
MENKQMTSNNAFPLVPKLLFWNLSYEENSVFLEIRIDRENDSIIVAFE